MSSVHTLSMDCALPRVTRLGTFCLWPLTHTHKVSVFPVLLFSCAPYYFSAINKIGTMGPVGSPKEDIFPFKQKPLFLQGHAESPYLLEGISCSLSLARGICGPSLTYDSEPSSGGARLLSQHLGGRGWQISEFEDSLVCRVSSRIARATQRNPVSKNQKNQTNTIFSPI